MVISSDLLTKTAQTLEQHSDAIRIKKLIFSLSKKYWENDLTFINRFSLAELLQDLIESTPTKADLINAINTLVRSLNRAQVYVPLAQLVIQEIAIFYPQNSNSSAPNPLSQGNLEQGTDNFNPEKIIEQITSTLFHHAEENRIKKLLFSVYCDRWENNPNLNSQHEFQRLILDIYQTYTASQDLQIALIRRVKKINKPQLYRAIASIILNAFEPLYRKTTLNPSNLKLTSASQTIQPSFETQVMPLPPFPEHHKPTTIPSPSHQSTTIINLAEEKPISNPLQQKPVERKLLTPTAKSLSKTYDRFELRRMIMQYSNPLRAKILLFSVIISPWNVDHPDWTRLRSRTLDNLVEQLITSGMGLSEINIKLQAAASIFPETNDALQSVSTIIDAIKPFVLDNEPEGSKPRKKV